jgi:hypothetical protein
MVANEVRRCRRLLYRREQRTTTMSNRTVLFHTCETSADFAQHINAAALQLKKSILVLVTWQSQTKRHFVRHAISLPRCCYTLPNSSQQRRCSQRMRREWSFRKRSPNESKPSRKTDWRISSRTYVRQAMPLQAMPHRTKKFWKYWMKSAMRQMPRLQLHFVVY